MTDTEEFCPFKSHLMVMGYEFARDYGCAFPRNELMEEILHRSRLFLKTDEEYLNEIVGLMLEHGMIVPAGRKLIWNHAYKAKPGDSWFGKKPFERKVD